ncbi:MAG: glycosyltransferase [Candidatus Shapirobacteria bacterium]
MIGCDCVIPFYNEYPRILGVLAVVSKVKSLRQIIAVDDGSSDGAAAKIKTEFPRVRLVRLAKNQGKAGAVGEGLKLVNQPYVLLLDGDLLNLQVSELENALQKIKARPEIDLLILRNRTTYFGRSASNYLRKDVFISGERILRSADLRRILQAGVSGFRLEAATNKYMREKGKRVFWIESTIVNLHKAVKRGWRVGWRDDFLMYLEILRGLGLKEYLAQMFFFARDEVK